MRKKIKYSIKEFRIKYFDRWFNIFSYFLVDKLKVSIDTFLEIEFDILPIFKQLC